MQLVKIHKIKYHPSSKGYILILKNDRIKVPILIGSNEAQSLTLVYEGIKLPRPTTHDLIINIIKELDADLESIIIHQYEKGTFYANLKIKRSTSIIDIDTRPSDAIAIAFKKNIPININDEIIK